MPPSANATRELFGRLTRQARRTSKNPDAAQVHKLRVAIRRFSQALALLPEDMPGFRKIQRKLKNTLSLAGQVRDADVAIKLVARLKPAGVKALQARLSRRRTRSETRLLDSLRDLTVRRAIEPPAATAPPAQDAMVHAAKRLFKRGARAEDSKGLHRLRIAAKKLRYTLELLAPHTGRLPQIERLQSLLGAINDYETARRMVAEESGSKKLLGQLADQQRKKIRQFRRYWKSHFEGEDNVRKWMEDVSHAGRRAAAA